MVTPAGQPNVQESWDQAAEGLPGIGEFIGEIRNSTFMLASDAFGQKSDFGENVVLVLDCSVEQAIDPPDFNFDETRIILSVGKADNWNVMDGGQRVVNTKGGSMGNSKYQKFVKRVAKEMNVPVQQRGLTPYDARVWGGLRFHFKNESEPMPERLRREGGPTEIHTMLPIQWLQDAVPPLGVAGSPSASPSP